jgi:hypothetical protein
MYICLKAYKIALQRRQYSFCALFQTAPMLPPEKCVTIGKIMTIKSYELLLMKCTDRFLLLASFLLETGFNYRLGFIQTGFYCKTGFYGA